MSDLKIVPIGDGQYDLAFENDDLVVIGETATTWPQSVAQDVTYTLSTWFGESAFDRSVGFPWQEGVFGENPIDGVGSLVYDFIVGVDGVEGMDEAPILDFDAANSRLTINATATGREFTVPVTLEVTA